MMIVTEEVHALERVSVRLSLSSGGGARQSSRSRRNRMGTIEATERDPDVVGHSRVLRLLWLSVAALLTRLLERQRPFVLPSAASERGVSQHSTDRQ